MTKGNGQGRNGWEVPYESRQLLTASLIDDTLPSAGDLRMISVTSEALAPTGSPLALKGSGRAGTNKGAGCRFERHAGRARECGVPRFRSARYPDAGSGPAAGDQGC